MPEGMTYIVQRKDRFYVVAYDGLDPLTGKERRRWHPVGRDRHDAEVVAARIDRDNAGAAPARGGPMHLGQFMTETWLPLKRRHVRATTAYRYSWFVDRYITTPPSATSLSDDSAPTTSTGSTSVSPPPADAKAPGSHQRRSTRST